MYQESVSYQDFIPIFLNNYNYGYKSILCISFAIITTLNNMNHYIHHFANETSTIQRNEVSKSGYAGCQSKVQISEL